MAMTEGVELEDVRAALLEKLSQAVVEENEARIKSREDPDNMVAFAERSYASGRVFGICGALNVVNGMLP